MASGFSMPGAGSIATVVANNETWKFCYLGAGCPTAYSVFTQQIDRTWYVHQNGYNFSYMDGHVKYTNATAVGTGTPWTRVTGKGLPQFVRGITTGGGDRTPTASLATLMALFFIAALGCSPQAEEADTPPATTTNTSSASSTSGGASGDGVSASKQAISTTGQPTVTTDAAKSVAQ